METKITLNIKVNKQTNKQNIKQNRRQQKTKTAIQQIHTLKKQTKQTHTTS